MVTTRELKSLRVLKGYTLQEMGQAIGRTSAAYLHKESGETAFTDGEKVKIVETLGLTFDQFNTIFFGGELKFDK